MSTEKKTPLLTQKELQAYLKVSKFWVDSRLHDDPGFPVVRLGTGARRGRRFDLDAVLAYLNSQDVA